ncbi:MAG TPA: YceI family protein [Verrucomicrobiota bacterium]|nr:YceI family protein [Verrucomicrobiota bacterium]
MKMHLLKSTLTLAAALACGTLAQAADGWIKYAAKPGCLVTIDGTSTIHDWTTKGAIIGGSFEVEPEFLTDKTLKSVKSLTTKEVNPKVQVKIPVKSLKSQVLLGASKMDEVMQEAMRMKDNPDILYTLKEMIVKGDVPASGSPVKFDTKGELTISGVTNTVDMEVTMTRVADDRVKFAGSKVLKMTDYKVPPPAPNILGMSPIKTGDEVTIKFDWLLGLQKTEPAAK